MRQQFILTIGRDLIAAALPGTIQIRGVMIDNPSGSWLQLFPTRDYIAPYKLGFARTLLGGVTSIDVRFVPGPTVAQPSTTAGDPPVVILDTDEVGTSPGVDSGTDIIESPTPSTIFVFDNASIDDGSVHTLWTPGPTERIRMFTFAAEIDAFVGGALGLAPAGGYVNIVSESAVIDRIMVNSEQANPPHEWPLGVNFPIGSRLRCQWVQLYGQVGATARGTFVSAHIGVV